MTPQSLTALTQLVESGPLPSNSLVLAILLIGGVIPFSAGLARVLQELFSGLPRRGSRGHKKAMLVVLAALPLQLVALGFQVQAFGHFMRDAMSLPVSDLPWLGRWLNEAAHSLSLLWPSNFWLKSPALSLLALALATQLTFECVRWLADGRQRRESRARADALLSAMERRNQEDVTPSRSPIRYF